MRNGANESATPERDEYNWLAVSELTAGPLVRFRHVRPEDQPLITEAIRTASRETLLHRFFSPIRSVSPDMLRQMLSIDRAKEMCIVGVVDVKDAPRIVCGARYVKLPKPEAAEIALTVHDEFQHRGLGTFLLKLLGRLARTDGIRRFEADVLASNQNMLSLLRKAALGPTASHRMGDVYHVVIDF